MWRRERKATHVWHFLVCDSTGWHNVRGHGTAQWKAMHVILRNRPDDWSLELRCRWPSWYINIIHSTKVEITQFKMQWGGLREGSAGRALEQAWGPELVTPALGRWTLVGPWGSLPSPFWPNGKAPGQWETLSQKTKVENAQETTPGIDLWLPAAHSQHTWRYTHTQVTERTKGKQNKLRILTQIINKKNCLRPKKESLRTPKDTGYCHLLLVTHQNLTVRTYFWRHQAWTSQFVPDQEAP